MKAYLGFRFFFAGSVDAVPTGPKPFESFQQVMRKVNQWIERQPINLNVCNVQSIEYKLKYGEYVHGRQILVVKCSTIAFKALFTRTDTEIWTEIRPVKVLHCINCDGHKFGQNGCRAHSSQISALISGTQYVTV